jgi:hypothetical protein
MTWNYFMEKIVKNQCLQKAIFLSISKDLYNCSGNAIQAKISLISHNESLKIVNF